MEDDLEFVSELLGDNYPTDKEKEEDMEGGEDAEDGDIAYIAETDLIDIKICFKTYPSYTDARYVPKRGP